MSTLPIVGEGLQPEAAGPELFPTFAAMRAARRWLVASPDKVPHYINGQRRGTTDTPDDLAQLSGYDEATATLARCGDGWHLGFALGPDENGGHWQGIDFDSVLANGLADLANMVPGYVEISPSGEGAHAIGYGQPFVALGSNGSGIEAYSARRYFTVTKIPIRDGGTVCLAAFVAKTLTVRHSAPRKANPSCVETIAVDDATKRDLRSALLSMRADDYHLWIRMGIALRELGEAGRALWMEWSTSSEKFEPMQAGQKWETFDPSDTGYQAVFAEAQRHGWLNPASSAAQPASAPAASDESGAAMLDRLCVDWMEDDDVEVPDIIDGLVADEDVTLLGGHGGIGKSFLALQMGCAVAVGGKILHRETAQRRVLYYSAEDGRKRLIRRLRKLIEFSGYDEDMLCQNLRVLDASEIEPLYGETVEHVDGRRPVFAKLLGARADFRNLQRMVEAFDPQLVIIDGASDTFDGNEIARREVRAFIKLLRQIHPLRPIGVLLNVHIDRSSARGHTTNDDGYAGSAQWHNSCRRRLFLQQEMRREKDDLTEEWGIVLGDIKLRVMKNQDGPPEPDMALERGMHGLWNISTDLSAITAVQKDEEDHGPTILRLIAAYYGRNKFMSTSLAPQASTGVFATLKSDPDFPARLSRKRTTELVRQLERDGLLIAEEYKRGNRAMGERWAMARGPTNAN